MDCEQISSLILLASLCMSYLSVTPFTYTEVRVCQLIWHCYGEYGWETECEAYGKLATLNLLETKIFSKIF